MPEPDPSVDVGEEPLSPAAGFLDLTVRAAAAELCEPVRGARALVVGCAEGRLCRALIARGAKAVVGLDREPARIEAARRVEAEERHGIDYGVLEPELIDPAVDGGFDLVVAAAAFEHASLGTLALAVGQIGRVLRVGGRFVLCVIHPAYPFAGPADAPLRIDAGRLGWFSARGQELAATVRDLGGATERLRYIHKSCEDYLEVLRRAGFGDLPEVFESQIGADHMALDPDYFRPLLDRPLGLGFRVRKTGAGCVDG